MGVSGLRTHLNSLEPSQGGYDPGTGPDTDDDDHTMTGMTGATAMMGAAVINGDEEDADEELEDADGGDGASFNHGQG